MAAREHHAPALRIPAQLCMFNFSANHLVLISRTEYPSHALLLMRDRDTQRVYRLYDFSKAQLIQPNVAYIMAGKVNSADKLYLVIESVYESGVYAVTYKKVAVKGASKLGVLHFGEN